MNQRQPSISEQQARELWQRALELQNAAEQRKPDPPALMPADRNDLSLSQVAAAAEGAGIDPDYVRMALAERQLPDADRIDPQLWSARWVKWILREGDAIECARPRSSGPSSRRRPMSPTTVSSSSMKLSSSAVTRYSRKRCEAANS